MHVHCALFVTLVFAYSNLSRRLVEGSKTLSKLRSLETQNERPVRDVIIRDCGIVQKLDVLRMM